jgi:3-hydroxybutyryl-CoA dehydrogenase
MMVLYRELGDQKFFPCALLRQLVQAGRLGDKSGRGVFEYGKK